MISTTATIRNRGQVTIPDKLRGSLHWLQKDSVVSIKAISDKELVIRPYEEEIRKIDWTKILKAVRKLRSFKGIKGSMSEFITEDRYRY